MNHQSLTILEPGLLTTIQDAGRFGRQSSGFSTAGAMDLPALQTANLLVHQPKNSPALEMTQLGATFFFGCEALIALTGGDFWAELDGVRVPTYAQILVKKGGVLRCNEANTGFRSYLAVAGGLDLLPELGSFSTDMKCQLGGLCGTKLKKNDVLRLNHSKISQNHNTLRMTSPPDDLDVSPVETNKRWTVRVLWGPQEDAFTDQGQDAFVNSWYQMSPESDRMGLRFTGPAVESLAGTDIISDGIVFGSVQIPPSGRPIVMMADHQTTGGYAKIATVISVDLPRLAQAKPGDYVRFLPISVKKSQILFRNFLKHMTYLEREFYI